MKVAFCKIKDAVSSPSQSKNSNSSVGPTESETEFRLQSPQPAPRKTSIAESFYELDALTGRLKGISYVSGGYESYDDPIYQETPHGNGDIMVHKTFETRTKRVDLNKELPILQRNDVSYV
jgi:hypothetical protein